MLEGQKLGQALDTGVAYVEGVDEGESEPALQAVQTRSAVAVQGAE